MQHNLSIVVRHSRKWRYRHKACKSLFLAQGRTANTNAVVYLGEDQISVSQSGLHLVVPVGSNSQWIYKRVVKGKRATSVMQTLAPSGAIVNPCISSKLYWAITIPSMLYGIDVRVD